MAKVFLLSKKTEANEGTYADALKYGDLTFLIKPNQFIDFYNLDEAIAWLNETLLNGYDPRYDHVLLTGNVMINALAVTSLMNKFNNVNVLLFDGRHNKYLQRVLTKQHFNIISKVS